MNLVLMSQDELTKKARELEKIDTGKSDDDPSVYLWTCGPIGQGVSLGDALPANTEYACIRCGLKSRHYGPSEAQYVDIVGDFYSLHRRGAAEARGDGNKEFLLANLWDVWTHVGAARDNDEPVDCDWVQKVLAECKEVINS